MEASSSGWRSSAPHGHLSRVLDAAVPRWAPAACAWPGYGAAGGGPELEGTARWAPSPRGGSPSGASGTARAPGGAASRPTAARSRGRRQSDDVDPRGVEGAEPAAPADRPQSVWAEGPAAASSRPPAPDRTQAVPSPPMGDVVGQGQPPHPLGAAPVPSRRASLSNCCAVLPTVRRIARRVDDGPLVDAARGVVWLVTEPVSGHVVDPFDVDHRASGADPRRFCGVRSVTPCHRQRYDRGSPQAG